MILIGTKSDLVNKREVSFDEGKSLADLLGIDFIETSSKMNKNVDEVFLEMAESLKKRVDKVDIGRGAEVVKEKRKIKTR